jgi:type I restriction enzyme S subunit
MIKPVLYDCSEYFGLALSAPQVQVQMVPKGSGLQHIHLEDLRLDAIPLAPMAEQREIVKVVECRLSIAVNVEASLERNRQRAVRLRQSILKRAFEGKMVPQDPKDEPAGVLLERIKVESKRSGGGSKARGRPRRNLSCGVDPASAGR